MVNIYQVQHPLVSGVRQQVHHRRDDRLSARLGNILRLHDTSASQVGFPIQRIDLTSGADPRLLDIFFGD